MSVDVQTLGIDVESRTVVAAAANLDAMAEAASGAVAPITEVQQAASGLETTARKVQPAVDAATTAVIKQTKEQRDAAAETAKLTKELERQAAAEARAAAAEARQQERQAAIEAKKKAAEAAKALAAAEDEAAAAAQRSASRLQQVGYQVGDVATQVLAGGDAFRAAAMQAGQLLGAFGAWGAIAGAALTVTVALGEAFFTGGDNAKTFADQLDALTGSASQAAEKLDKLNTAQRAILEQQSNAAAVKAGQAKDMFWSLFGAGDSAAIGTMPGSTPPGQQSDPIYGPGTPEAKFKQAQAYQNSLYKDLSDDEMRKYAQDIAERRRAAQQALPKAADPNAETRKANSLYPDESQSEIVAYGTSLNQRVVEAHTKQAALDKQAAERRAAAAKQAAEHAKTVAKSLEDLTVAANDNTAAMTKQEAAMKGAGGGTSIDVEKAQQQVRAVQDQAQIEMQLRRFRGDASKEQIEQARTALEAQAAAKRSLEDETKLIADQVQWRARLAQAKQQRGYEDQTKLTDLNERTIMMQVDEQRAKIDQTRQTFMAYGTAATDAFAAVAMGSEKASTAVSNLARTWANMAMQMVSQMALTALSRWLFPQATGAGAVGTVATGAIAGQRAGGGDVRKGETYVVGEHGREKFTPWTNGTITPNNPMGQPAGGDTVSINQTNHISLSGSATEEDAERMSKALDKKMNQTIDMRLARHTRSAGAVAA